MFFGGAEFFVLLAVIILLFGAKKIPELARGIGQGIVEFQKTTKDTDSEDSNGSSENH